MSGGLNRFKRLQKLNVGIKEDRRATRMLLREIMIPTEGPLAHPRRHKPIDQALVDDIVEKGILKPLTVWEQVGKNGKPVFILLDGSRRLRAGLEAEKVMKTAGKLLDEEGLYAKVEFFEGDEKECLKIRLLENSDPLKEPDLPSEIAVTFGQIMIVDPNATINELFGWCPPNVGYTPRVVTALLRWPSLPKAVAHAFDHGLTVDGGETEKVPVGLLPGLVEKVHRDDQMTILKELVEGGYTSYTGVTKFLNGKTFKAQIASEEPDVPSIEDDGLDLEKKSGTDNGPESGEAPTRPRKNKAQKTTNHTPSATAMVRKSWVKKIDAYLKENQPPADSRAEVKSFMAGAMVDVEEEVDVAGWSKTQLAMLTGIQWRRGGKVKLPVEIKDALRLAFEKPEPQGSKMTKKSGKGKKGKKDKASAA